MKSFNEYQVLAGVTRKLDEPPLEMAHYSLGLVGEAGELASPIRMTAEDYAKELGDCFWYAAGVCSVMELDLNTLTVGSGVSARYNLNNVLNIMLSSAAAVCEMAKKYAFYGKEPDTVSLVNNLQEYVNCTLYLCSMSGLDPLDVCAKNIAKLEARFGGKFDAFRAINRDVEAEAAAVAGGVSMTPGFESEALDMMKGQLIVALVKRAGGSLDIPVAEVDNTGQDILYMSVDQEKRVFHFEVRKKS